MRGIPEGYCIVCMHKLDGHIEETNGWRCHAISPDLLQCECWLRADSADFRKDYYDFRLRIRGRDSDDSC